MQTSTPQRGKSVHNPLEYLVDRAFDLLPKPVQWILIGLIAALLLALFGYLWSQGQLTW